jgi:hypothetical protein
VREGELVRRRSSMDGRSLAGEPSCDITQGCFCLDVGSCVRVARQASEPGRPCGAAQAAAEQLLVPTRARACCHRAAHARAAPASCELVARRPPAVREAGEVCLRTACARFHRARRRRPWPLSRPVLDLCAGYPAVSGVAVPATSAPSASAGARVLLRWRSPATLALTLTGTASAGEVRPGNAAASAIVGTGEVRPDVNVRNEKRVKEVRRIERELAAAQSRPGSRETKFQSVRPEPREKGFCIPRTRSVNRAKHIKHVNLHAMSLAKGFCSVSNTPTIITSP